MVFVVPLALTGGIYLAISLGIALLGFLLLPGVKSKSPLATQGPTALARRGALIPYLIGRRMLGSVFAYAGARRVTKEKVGGGKGGGRSQKQKIYHEQGWHLLAFPGPAKKLLEIQKSGKAIFKGPLTPSSHPSGTLVNLGKEGAFVIYWGEEDQPINTQVANKIGVSSRWPLLASIFWIDKRLGTSPVWPFLKYIYEIGLNYSLLVNSIGFKEPSHAAGNRTIGIHSADNATNKFRLRGNWLTKFYADSYFDLEGNAAGDQTLQVEYSEFVVSVNGTDIPGGAPIADHIFTQVWTDVYITTDLVGADNNGTMRYHIDGTDHGYNPAHMIAQILFAPFPYGFSLDQDLFDINGSLESLGTLMQAEGMFGSVVSRESGSEAMSVLGGILMDIGCLISLDVVTQKYIFVPIRNQGDVIPHFTEEFFEDPEPEIDTPLMEKATSRVVFVFEDEANNFADNTSAGFDDQGEFRLLQYFRAKQIRLILPTNFDTAHRAAERRSQEELGKGAAFKLKMNKGARLLLPGTKFTTAYTEGTLLCVGKEVDPDTSSVVITAMADFVSAVESTFVSEPGVIPDDILPVAPPLIYGIVEVPAYLSAGLELLVVPLVRAHEQILSHELWISEDDITYRQILDTTSVQAGGFLIDEIPADTVTGLASGLFTFTEAGPDITTLVLDLSGDSAGWRRGRQLLLIQGEILFLDGIVTSGGDWSFGRLLRGRYDTTHQTHPAGTPFFILEFNDVEPINEPEIFPGATVYIKPIAFASEGYSLSDIIATTATLTGKGVTPAAPLALLGRGEASSAFCNAYATGDDTFFRWSYHSFVVANTGAGLQPAGNAHTVSPVGGDFRIEFLTVGETQVASYFSDEAEFSYSNASLVSDFGGEPPSFLIRVTLVQAGLDSVYTETTMVRE